MRSNTKQVYCLGALLLDSLLGADNCDCLGEVSSGPSCSFQVLIGGDDFKSGQTKMKSVLVDFLVGAGIKPTAIVSYNHLGNNDGMNLSAPQTFRSKEISKSNVVDDMVRSICVFLFD